MQQMDEVMTVTVDSLVEALREDLYRLLDADGRSIPKICKSAGVHDSAVYLFLKRSRGNLCATSLLSLAEAMGYRVTFEKVAS